MSGPAGSQAAKLLAVLALEERKPDVFVGQTPSTERQRIFGGQVAGQALMAAGLTVPADRPVHSLHSYFLRPGDPTEEIRYAVDRIRDGRSFTTRRVVAWQDRKGEEVAIFSLTADFHAGEKPVAEHSLPMPDVPGPENLLGTAEIAARHGERAKWMNAMGQVVEQRFLADPFTAPPKTYPDTKSWGWFRVAGLLGDDAAVQAAALTFVSDLTLLSAGLRPARRRLAGLHRREPRPLGVVPPPGPRRRVVPLRDRQPGRRLRPGAVLRPDLGRRRHARRHGGPGGAHPVTRRLRSPPPRARPRLGPLGLLVLAASAAASAAAAGWPPARLRCRTGAVLLGGPLGCRRGEVGRQPVVALAQEGPHPLDVRPGGGRRADGDPQHGLAAHGRVGQEHLAAVVEPLQQRHGGDVGVHVVGPAGPQADQRERMGGRDVEPLVGLRPAGQFLGQGDVRADVGAQPLGAVPAQHEPQLERAEPAAQRDLPVAEVDDGAGVGGGVAQVLGEDRQRAGERRPVGDPEQGGVEAGEQPLVRVGGVAVGPLDAGLQRAQLRARSR